MRKNEILNNNKKRKGKISLYCCPNCFKVIKTVSSRAEYKMNLKTPQGKVCYIFCSQGCIDNYKLKIKREKQLTKILGEK